MVKMSSFNISRKLFQLFALGLFVYQLQNSIIKYITGPVTTQTSTTTFEDIEKPVIYLCQEEQFNYTEARNNRYRTVTDFTKGYLNNSNKYTWNGRHGNISYHDIQDRIYNTVNYSNNHFDNSNTGDLSDYNSADTEMVYFALLGFCLNIMPTKKFTSVTSTHKSELYLVDPTEANKLSMYGSNVAKIIFGPTHMGYYDDLVFEIEVRIHDMSIHNGITCMDYGSMGTSYDSCVLNEMEKFLLEWFKCLPPWFPKSSTLTCEYGKIMEINDDDLTMSTQFLKFIDGFGMDILKPCLPPCVSMHFKLNEISHITNKIDNAILKIKVKDEIKVHTDVYAYDIFNLVVDLGSSLGLWLGLSALSIFDALVEFCMATIRKYYH